jgi:hypothetical protein
MQNGRKKTHYRIPTEIRYGCTNQSNPKKYEEKKPTNTNLSVSLSLKDLSLSEAVL